LTLPQPSNGSDRPPRRLKTYVWYFLALAVLSAAAIIIPIIANLKQQLTPEQLADARARWQQHGPASYDLRYVERIDSEEVGDEYMVKVRDREIVSLRVNGQLVALETMKPEQRRKYTVPGMFDQIEEHLTEEKDGHRRNFATADFDPATGYPRHYIRRVHGSRSRLEWMVKVTAVKE
jgi:hypothetical protein